MSKEDRARRKEEKRRAKIIARAAKRQAKAAKPKHRHDDHGRTYTVHRRGKLVLITECTCGKIVARDKLE